MLVRMCGQERLAREAEVVTRQEGSSSRRACVSTAWDTKQGAAWEHCHVVSWRPYLRDFALTGKACVEPVQSWPGRARQIWSQSHRAVGLRNPPGVNYSTHCPGLATLTYLRAKAWGFCPYKLLEYLGEDAVSFADQSFVKWLMVSSNAWGVWSSCLFMVS